MSFVGPIHADHNTQFYRVFLAQRWQSLRSTGNSNEERFVVDQLPKINFQSTRASPRFQISTPETSHRPQNFNEFFFKDFRDLIFWSQVAQDFSRYQAIFQLKKFKFHSRFLS
jgi:hypothetical protein